MQHLLPNKINNDIDFLISLWIKYIQMGLTFPIDWGSLATIPIDKALAEQ